MTGTEQLELYRNIAAWEQALRELQAAKTNELTLRNKIFSTCFPNPKEGANTYEDASIIIKATQKWNRTFDAAALPVVLNDLPEGTEDQVIKYTPELKLGAYRALPDDVRRKLEVAMVIKPGTPSIDAIKTKE